MRRTRFHFDKKQNYIISGKFLFIILIVAFFLLLLVFLCISKTQIAISSLHAHASHASHASHSAHASHATHTSGFVVLGLLDDHALRGGEQ
jgi:hypothetical protein